MEEEEAKQLLPKPKEGAKSKSKKAKNSDEEGEEEAEAEHDHMDEPVLKAIEKFTCLVNVPLGYLLPVKRLPELAFLMIFVLIYFMCEFILTVFNVFSVYTGLSHFFVGLTLMVWGSDNLELINFTIAMKNKQLELGLSSVLTCQVICLIVIIPLACLLRMHSREQSEIQVI